MMTKIQPKDMAAYLDSVRPMMDDIQVGMFVSVGSGLLQVIKVNTDSCLVKVRYAPNDHRWIRVEQIEYVYPY